MPAGLDTLATPCTVVLPQYPSTSRLQQKDHYDRRTRVDKEARGHEYATGLLEKALAHGPTQPGPSRLSEPGPSRLSEPGPSRLNEPRPSRLSEPGPSRLSEPRPSQSLDEPIVASDDEDEDRPGVGDIVAIMLPNSTPTQPAFELGKVQRISARGTLRYLPLEDAGGSMYRCTAGSMGRAALDSAVYPVGIQFDHGTKLYTLLSDPVAIHMAHSRQTATMGQVGV